MLRIVLSIVALLFPIFTVIAADSTVWEPLELGFYSRIHDNIDNTIDTLRKKEVSKFKTFSGFWTCRPAIAWLDREPMNEQILIDIVEWDLSRLSDIMQKNKILGTSDSDGFANLVSCLAETYNQLGDIAAKDEEALSSMWILWIYTDGDTKNSDYDIVADIEKLNAIIFTEKLDYIGKVNVSKESFSALAEGTPIPSVTSAWGSAENNTTNNSDTSWTSNTPSLQALGISDMCTVSDSPTSVSNIANSDFLDELESVLAGWTPPLWWASYGPAQPINTLTPTNIDFFDTPPCTDNFCIRVKSIPWEIKLVWGKSYSIESLIDKHTAILMPIANSNLATQKMSKNYYEQLNLNLQFKELIPLLLHIEERPQQVKQYKVEYTKEIQEKEFEEMRRCAYVAAWLPSDKNRANILWGEGFQLWTNTNTENIDLTTKSLSVIDPEDSVLAGCMDIAMGMSRGKYYESFATDLTELESFTTALVNILNSGTIEHKELDKKKKN